MRPAPTEGRRVRIVLQRVSAAQVRVAEETVARIGPGLVALVGVAPHDTVADARRMAAKTAALRIFGGPRGGEVSVAAARGSVLVVSQFTLLADTRRGNRPSWSKAAAPAHARGLVDEYSAALEAAGIPVATGVFGAHMAVELVNDGPVTIVVDSVA